MPEPELRDSTVQKDTVEDVRISEEEDQFAESDYDFKEDTLLQSYNEESSELN